MSLYESDYDAAREARLDEEHDELTRLTQLARDAAWETGWLTLEESDGPDALAIARERLVEYLREELPRHYAEHKAWPEPVWNLQCALTALAHAGGEVTP